VGIKHLKGILFSALVIVSLISSLLFTRAQGAEFSIQPRSFTERDVPPSGEPYHLEIKLRINNGDNIKRTFVLWVETPENLTPGYEVIPEPSWIVLVPQVIEINENSFGLIDIYLNIPRQENLTSKKWEALIVVKRQAETGEVLELELTCPAKIETSAELPPPAGGRVTTSLTISEENFTLQAGESKYITATLTSGGNPIKEENIIWSATAGTIAPSSGKTNTAGQVSVVYTAPSYETLVIVSASYAGSEQYESSSASSYGTITASSAPSGGVSPMVYVGAAVVIVVIIAAVLILKFV